MRSAVYRFAMLTLVLVPSHPLVLHAQADGEPTLKETTDWITTVVPRWSTRTSSDWVVWHSDVSFDRCLLRYTSYVRWISPNPAFAGTSAEPYTVNLGAIDPISVVATERQDWAGRYWTVDARPTGGGPGVFWRFIEREHAKRVTSALKHAVRLCGGKVEPF